MPTLTQILASKRGPNWLRVYLDGVFAFTLNANVIAKFKLRPGQTVTEEQVENIRRGEVRQECFDLAMKHLQLRLHSRTELRRKLLRRDISQSTVDEVLAQLEKLDYLNDARYARTRAMAAAQHKHHGRRRAMVELMRAGVSGEVAEKALDDVYSEGGVGGDSTATARLLAQKQAARLKKLDPATARRRLAGMLQRRGFDYETIKPVIDEVLGEDEHE